MTIRTINFVGNGVADKATFIACHDACVDGDVINITGSGEIDLGISWNWTKAIEVKAAARGSAWSHSFLLNQPELFTRLVTIRCISFVSVSHPKKLILRDIKMGIPKNIWPDFPGLGETWQSKVYGTSLARCVLDCNAGVNTGLELYAVEGMVGYGNNCIAYVPGTKYPGQYSPATYYAVPAGGGDAQGRFSKVQDATYTIAFSQPGHGDTGTLPNQNGNLLYNDMLNSPAFIGGQCQHFYNEDCYVHDSTFGMAAGGIQGIPCDWKRSRGVFERNILFDEQMGPIGTDNGVPVVTSTGIFYGCLAHNKDLGNPHRDFTACFQIGGTPGTNDGRQTLHSHKNFFIPNPLDFGFATAVRDQPTPTTAGGDNPHAVGHQFYGNFAIQNAGLQLDNCMEDQDIVANVVAPAAYFTPSYPGQTYAEIHAYRAVPGQNYSHVEVTRGRMEGNVSETLLTDTKALLTNNTIITLATEGTALVAPTTAPATIEELFQNLRPKPGVVNSGVALPYATVAEMRASTDVSWIPPHALPVDLAGTTTSQASKLPSGLAFKHGGNWGDGHTITPGTGLEWREVDYDRTTQLQGWSGAPGTIHTGKYLQLRALPSASAGAVKTTTYTIGSRSFTWKLVAQSNNKLPAASVDGVTLLNTLGLKTHLAGNAKITDARQQSGFFIFKLTGTANKIFYESTVASEAESYFAMGTQVGVFTSAPDASGAVGVFNSQVVSPDDLNNGQVHAVAWSIDRDAPDFASGFRFYVDGVDASASHYDTNWMTAQKVVSWDRKWSIFDKVFSDYRSGVCPMDLYALGLTNTLIDWSTKAGLLDPNNPDQIGWVGDGLTADGSPMTIFGVGDAAKINAGTFNLNTVNPFAKIAGTAVDKAIANGVLPGTHQVLLTTLLTPIPTVGQPVEVLVQFSGANAPTVVTPTWGGVARTGSSGAVTAAARSNGVILSCTPTAAGDLTLALSNDMGHTNPGALTIAVAARTALAVIPLTVRPGAGLPGTPFVTSLSIYAA